ncbi:MAG: hypothetical protein ACRDZZ_09275, partial [Ilumatobacteraceae bacterium]
MPRTRAAAVGVTRPAGVSPGALALAGAWVVALAVARLTGSAAVVILLGAGLVGAVWAAVAGWLQLRSFRLLELTTVASTTVGDTVAVTARAAGRAGDVFVRVIDRGHVLVSGWLRAGHFGEHGSFDRRGE